MIYILFYDSVSFHWEPASPASCWGVQPPYWGHAVRILHLANGFLFTEQEEGSEQGGGATTASTLLGTVLAIASLQAILVGVQNKALKHHRIRGVVQALPRFSRASRTSYRKFVYGMVFAQEVAQVEEQVLLQLLARVQKGEDLVAW